MDEKNGSTEIELRPPKRFKFTTPEPVRTESPSGNDTSSVMRDDDPQSGDSKGVIYDIDIPGVSVHIPGADTGSIIRQRVNFKTFARFKTVDGRWERCSNFFNWSTARSIKLIGTRYVGIVAKATDNTVTIAPNPEWKPNQWANAAIRTYKIQEGEVVMVQNRVVTGNTTDTLTVRPKWTVKPSATDFIIMSTQASWSDETTVKGDNQIKIGEFINLTWDLNETND
jgi:hypothetical protein